MAQQTSELWKQLWETQGTTREFAFDINGTWYGPDAEVSHNVTSELYSEFGIGNATTSKLSLNLFADEIPRAATIKRYIRLKNGDTVSEWLPHGVFFANRRTEDAGYWTVEAFDVMRKAEQEWKPRQNITFPMTMKAAVDEFASIMGCELDPRTNVSDVYTIDYPANEYTIRQELQFIAAAHAGNWIVTAEGKLLLVPLLSMPEETFYLVTEHGKAITLGGVRIFVG